MYGPPPNKKKTHTIWVYSLMSNFLGYQVSLMSGDLRMINSSLARKAPFEAPTFLVSILWFSSAVAVFMGEAAKLLLVEGFKRGCNVVLRDKRGTL